MKIVWIVLLTSFFCLNVFSHKVLAAPAGRNLILPFAEMPVVSKKHDGDKGWNKPLPLTGDLRVFNQQQGPLNNLEPLRDIESIKLFSKCETVSNPGLTLLFGVAVIIVLRLKRMVKPALNE